MAKKSFLGFVSDQFRRLPPVVQADLKGKTVLVVGANTGLGFGAAEHFARMGAGKLILACRNEEKGEAAIKRLREATGCSRAELWIVDLAEFSSVKAIVARAEKYLERLDILLLNAAISPGLNSPYSSTTDGWEKSLQVNNISSSLLALLLLPRMLDTAKQFNTIPRIVIVSSEVHFWTSFEDKVFESPNAFELLSSEAYCTSRMLQARYYHTKLLNVFFARALGSRLKDQPIIVNNINPGFCKSKLFRDISSIRLKVFKSILARSVEEGSRQLVWAAVGVPEGNGHSMEDLQGAYVHQSRVEEPSDFVIGEEGKKREDKLWADLVSVLEKIEPRVKDAVQQLR